MTSEEESKKNWSSLWRSEDWWACWFGFLLFFLSLVGLINVVPKPQSWVTNPLSAVSTNMALPIFAILLCLLVMYSIEIKFMKGSQKHFALAFTVLFSLGFLAHLISKQATINSYGLEYVLWALLIGIIISNTKGLPRWLKEATKTELYIKTGLVLLGAEILFSTILNLGMNGLLLAWGVTPLVLVLTYYYGSKKLGLEKKLALLIAAATSVCGVSAAIAVASASRAKKEHLSLTISISLMFTAVMLVGLPGLIRIVGLDYTVGGAWIGGTIDSTGAVVAAGELLSEEAMEVAAVIKLIQNVLIGVIAFIVAILWITKIERTNSSGSKVKEIWFRFPKFVLGFVMLSLLTSFVLIPLVGHNNVIELLKVTKGIRSYIFGLAFVSIGLETKFSELRNNMKGGNPIKSYLIGQAANIILTFVFAWLLFS